MTTVFKLATTNGFVTFSDKPATREDILEQSRAAKARWRLRRRLFPRRHLYPFMMPVMFSHWGRLRTRSRKAVRP